MALNLVRRILNVLNITIANILSQILTSNHVSTDTLIATESVF